MRENPPEEEPVMSTKRYKAEQIVTAQCAWYKISVRSLSIYAGLAFLLLLMLIPESAFGDFPAWIGVPLLFLTNPYVLILLFALGGLVLRKA